MFFRVFKGSGLQKIDHFFQTPTQFKNSSSSLHLKTGPSGANRIIYGNRISFYFHKQVRAMASNPSTLNIRTITKNDEDIVIEFLKKNFYADEPLTKYIKLLDHPASVKTLTKYSLKNIGQNRSFLAISQTEELAGVCLNSVKTRNDSEEETETDPIFSKITGVLGYAYDESKVFEKFPDVDKVLSVDIISVDSKFQGQGIAKILMDKTRELARKQGIKLLRVDCTSHYSARASEKLGMKCVYELKYADYKVNGEQVFKPEPPHTGVKIYVQRLDQ